ncbi:MAG: PDC sensor domain-containing protein [Rhizobiaceae bacterium]|nr:PDC sensor domain-containing protein [Rhizobiaceae bacterium]
MRLGRLGAAILFVLAGAMARANDEPYVGPVAQFVIAHVKPWIDDPLIVSAVKAQNAVYADLDQAAIDALDQTWRIEVESDAHPMVDRVLASPLSNFLRRKQEQSEGMITEIFVTDAKGLNVGQSDVTSDYWQGDEDKFRKSFGAGHGALFIDPPERDESTQILQCQASMTVVDETGRPIGAITVGVNLDQL